MFPNQILLVSFQDSASDTKRDPGGKCTGKDNSGHPSTGKLEAV